MLGTGHVLALVAAVLIAQQAIGGTSTTSTVSTTSSPTTVKSTSTVTSSATSVTTSLTSSSAATSSVTSSNAASSSTSGTATSTATSTQKTSTSNSSTGTDTQTTSSNTTTAPATTESATTSSNASENSTTENSTDTTTVDTTSDTSTTATSTTTKKPQVPDIYVTCESAYSYNYLVLQTTCQIHNMSHAQNVSRDLISIECFEQVGCDGNLTSIGSVTTSNTSKGMFYNISTQSFTMYTQAPNVTTQYTCKFIATGQTLNTSWEFLVMPIKAVFASPSNDTMTQLRVLVTNHPCTNETVYSSSKAFVYFGNTNHSSHKVQNITRHNQSLWEYIFHFTTHDLPNTAHMRILLGDRYSVSTHVFIRRDPDEWPIIGTLGYIVLAFLLFMLFALLYITYVLMRQRNPWAYRRLDEEKPYPVPYFKQW
ncbi:Cy152/Cy151 [Cynomolgus cytomegalovirus]|nr:Cy152/Cy151 [Cynomolgus cytomegalovirus]APT39313.1 Cy152/Cy151 [Cynomolgus cytomegalovirus]APT39502.1 Cy152/Cy151 [Cynomolgus cytomegalovirus]APT39697.1 Cy152/Cy151 [Cynomolgus cytomegalovirus]APT39848.1 Cy152/Cy151 [Cynomolgus cytomegalovirus]WAQ80485.1 Cy152/Cy151 [Cynomolgus cytomegalovirus]